MRGATQKIFFASALVIAFHAIAQVSKKQAADFRRTCYTIADAFAKKNTAVLNKFIDPQTGVYIITRPGAIDKATNYRKIESKDEWILKYPYKDSVKVTKYKLTYGIAPHFDCGDNKWNKKGFVADSVTGNDRLSALLALRNKYESEQHTVEGLAKLKELEKKSCRVVFTEIAKGRGLVFQLMLINGKWHLFLVDTVASSCEA